MSGSCSTESSFLFISGPIIGGELVRSIGFQWVMRIVGLANLAYCPLLIYVAVEQKKPLSQEEKKDYNSIQMPVSKYERFYDSDDGL